MLLLFLLQLEAALSLMWGWMEEKEEEEDLLRGVQLVAVEALQQLLLDGEVAEEDSTPLLLLLVLLRRRLRSDLWAECNQWMVEEEEEDLLQLLAAVDLEERVECHRLEVPLE